MKSYGLVGLGLLLVGCAAQPNDTGTRLATLASLPTVSTVPLPMAVPRPTVAPTIDPRMIIRDLPPTPSPAEWEKSAVVLDRNVFYIPTNELLLHIEQANDLLATQQVESDIVKAKAQLQDGFKGSSTTYILDSLQDAAQSKDTYFRNTDPDFTDALLKEYQARLQRVHDLMRWAARADSATQRCCCQSR